MAPQQNGIKLATYLILQSFSDNVSKVAECLLQHGPLTANQIAQRTQIPRDDVKTSLLVLIQHNCVQSFSRELKGDFERASNVSVEYVILFDNIMHRLRFSKFFMIVLDHLGNQCASVLQGLLEHGRLTLKQIIDRSKEGGKDPEGIREALVRLAAAHYVERCPSADPFLALPTEEEASQKKKDAKYAKTMKEIETVVQRAVAEAAPLQAKRFLVQGIETDTNEENSGGNYASNQIGEKRKSDAAGLDEEIEKEILWRPNFEKFVHHLRCKALVANVRSRLDEGAAIVLNAMLEASRSSETKVKAEHSALLSLNDIYEEVMKSAPGRAMTLDHVRSSLRELCSKGAEFRADLKNIIELAQREEVESIVLNRYGKIAYRVFRLLSKADRFLETDKIADEAFVEKKDATSILFKLWKANYLDMEKFSSTVSKPILFALWKVNKEILWPHVLDEMHHAALNLKLRLAHELEQEKELMDRPANKLTGVRFDRRVRIENIRLLLESSLLKLDDAIMLFHDF